MNLVSNSNSTSTSSRLDIMFDEPIVIDLTETITWKRNNVSEESRNLYGTEGVEYGIIHGTDLDGVVEKYRISKNVWQKCIDSDKNTVYIADDGRNIQLILPSTGSPRILAKLAALRAKKQQLLLQPKGDDSLPF